MGDMRNKRRLKLHAFIKAQRVFRIAHARAERSNAVHITPPVFLDALTFCLQQCRRYERLELTQALPKAE